jgi:hypothetical protein
MVRKAFKLEQIINKLREAEVLLSQGLIGSYEGFCEPSCSL